MSTSLYWRPVPQDTPPARDLPYDLKKAISQRFWGHDGSLYGDEVELTQAHVMYLEGLRDAGVDGAADLIAAIRAHGAIELWIAG